jgi:hypothetical protein
MAKQESPREDGRLSHAWEIPQCRSIAERELSAFVNSVTSLLGPEQAMFLTDVWLDELASMESMPGPSSLDWRLVTIAASARLATRLAGLEKLQT